jgi:hypothetical protein
VSIVPSHTLSRFGRASAFDRLRRFDFFERSPHSALGNVDYALNYPSAEAGGWFVAQALSTDDSKTLLATHAAGLMLIVIPRFPYWFLAAITPLRHVLYITGKHSDETGAAASSNRLARLRQRQNRRFCEYCGASHYKAAGRSLGEYK